MKETFIRKQFRPASMAIIEQANAIIAEYQSQGYRLTLRQLYYQFVARDLLENVQRNYKKLGGIIGDARLAGLIDWAAIEDRTRNLESRTHWNSPQEIINASATWYHKDQWAGQDFRVEVWVEKRALQSVVGRACNKLDVPYFASVGYPSLSEVYDFSKRILRHVRVPQRVLVIHLADHDPSGMDMTRDLADRLAMFTGLAVDVNRIALNYDQVEEHNPPPNPAKITDSRAEGYISVYGTSGWELDALPPDVLERVITDAITPYINEPVLAEVRGKQLKEQAELLAVAGRWNDVVSYVDTEFGNG